MPLGSVVEMSSEAAFEAWLAGADDESALPQPSKKRGRSSDVSDGKLTKRQRNMGPDDEYEPPTSDDEMDLVIFPSPPPKNRSRVAKAKATLVAVAHREDMTLCEPKKSPKSVETSGLPSASVEVVRAQSMQTEAGPNTQFEPTPTKPQVLMIQSSPKTKITSYFPILQKARNRPPLQSKITHWFPTLDKNLRSPLCEVDPNRRAVQLTHAPVLGPESIDNGKTQADAEVSTSDSSSRSILPKESSSIVHRSPTKSPLETRIDQNIVGSRYFSSRNTRKSATAISSEVPSSDAAGQALASITPSENPSKPAINTDDIGPCERATVATLKRLSIVRHISAPVSSPSIPETVEDPFAFIYDEERFPIIPGRNFIAEVSRNPQKNWVLYGLSEARSCRLAQLRSEMFSRSQASAICDKLVEATKRWPQLDDLCGRSNATMTRLSEALVWAAQYSALPDLPTRVHAPKPAHREGNTIWLRINLIRIDPQSLQHRRHTFWSKDSAEISEPANITVSFDDGATYQPRHSDGTFQSVTQDPMLAQLQDNEKRALQRAEAFLLYVSHLWHRQGPFKTDQQANDFLHNVQRCFVPSSDQRHRIFDGLYDGVRLLSSVPVMRGRVINPNKKVRDDIPGIPTMVIRSWDSAWADQAMLACISTWLTTNDLFAAWRELAREVDRCNLRVLAGEEAPGTCHCDPDEAAHSEHPCSQCSRITPCLSLEIGLFGVRACPHCRSQRGRSRPESIAWRTADESYKKSIKMEFKKSSWPDGGELFKQTRLEGQEVITRWLDGAIGTSYVNSYSGKVNTPPPIAHHPLTISVDACEPFGVTTSGRAFVHTASNIAFIPLALNYAKHTMLPVALQGLSRYHRAYISREASIRTGDPVALAEISVLQEQLIVDVERWTIIRFRTGWLKRDRSAPRVRREQLTYFRQEWVSGKFHFIGPRPFSYHHRVTRKQNHTAWYGPVRDRLLRVIGEIESWTGVQLPQRHGCPYFCHPSTIPWDWDWHLCESIMSLRLTRMKRTCNRKWVTEDNTETLYLECIFQVCLMRMVIHDDDPDADEKKRLQDRYQEFLGLPLHLDGRNPLRFTIAHRIHGKAMHTGWIKIPASLKDRTDSRNNILIESTTSNFLKWNFAEPYYPLLKQIFADVHMPRELVDEELVPSPSADKWEPVIDSDTDFSDDEADDESED